uniref:Uncharacterized protein n=1 Tax=Acrobeloides nanus TaxID=290746 RepID=A0A914DYZ9_9BILA
MQSLFIATIIFSIFCFAGKSDAAAKKSDDNDASNRVNAPGVNEYLVATFEVATTFTSQNDGIKVQKLAYNIIRPYWWWCFRICTYHYYNGYFWVVRYTIIYRYPCWPWYYALNAVVNADGSRAAASDDGTNDRFDIVAIGKEALNTDPLNIRSICVIFNDKIFEYVSKCYAEDAVCSA